LRPKPQKEDLLLIVVKMISNNSQQFGIRGEPLFIKEASTSFSFFINSFSLKLAYETNKEDFLSIQIMRLSENIIK
jgi:hypothetical protein